MLEKKTVSQCINSDYCRGWNDAVDEMPRWNNVADKLPFYNTTVLCIDIDNKHVFIGNMLTCHLYQNKGAMCCAVQGLHGVRYATYWMHLPEPPEEAANDQ